MITDSFEILLVRVLTIHFSPLTADLPVSKAKEPFNQEQVIATYKSLIRRMPRPNQHLLFYVLDLLMVFASKCDKNLMTATSKYVFFQSFMINPNFN